MSPELPFFIVGVVTPDGPKHQYHQMLTCSNRETAEKLAALIHETIRVTGGVGDADITEVKE